MKTINDKITLRQYGKPLIIEHENEEGITTDNNQPCITLSKNSNIFTKGNRSPGVAVRDDCYVKTLGLTSKGCILGDNSNVETLENFSPAIALGNNCNIITHGSISHCVSTGINASMTCKGPNSILIALGRNAKFKAPVNGCFSGTYFDKENNRIRIKIAYVGENGIEPNIWYSLTTNGEWIKLSKQNEICNYEIKGANNINFEYYKNDNKNSIETDSIKTVINKLK